jgi:outer membrane protein TolC
VGFEVEQAYHDAEDASERLDAYTRATGYAKKWLIQVQQGIDIGTMEENDVLEPAKEYALKRYAMMGAVFDYNLALAKLALATGWDAVAGDE